MTEANSLYWLNIVAVGQVSEPDSRDINLDCLMMQREITCQLLFPRIGEHIGQQAQMN